MKRKKIVLSGVGTVNKGAELMIYAILQEIELKFPDAIVYIEEQYNLQGINYIKSNLELRYKPIAKWKKIYPKFHIRGIFNRLHISQVHLDDVYAVSGTDYFIDASGFLVSDLWNLSNNIIRRWQLLLKRNKSAGAKIVFLPQAFGPIEKNNTKRLLSNINEYADVIMPRENVSYNYIKNSGIVDMNKVKLYTDFTSLVEGFVPENYKHLNNAVCVIPNVRMTDKGAMQREDYIIYLSSIINMIKEQGKNIYILNHEGIEDERISYQIQEKVGKDVEVVTDLNALEVKGMISTAYLVISSRFHGVASSLNSCVPCLATSWSHKYVELFKDYKQDDCLLPLDNLDESIIKIKDFLNEHKNIEIVKSLTEIKPIIQTETRKMWEEVWKDQ